MTPTTITPLDFPEIRWRGHWIWVPEEPVVPSGMFSAMIDPHARESHGLFRKTFLLEQLPVRAPARITADFALCFVHQRHGIGARTRPQPIAAAAL